MLQEELATFPVNTSVSCKEETEAPTSVMSSARRGRSERRLKTQENIQYEEAESGSMPTTGRNAV